MAFDTVDKILTYAIEREEHAARFYANLANRTDLKHMKETLLGFAEEEKEHKAKLMAIKEGKKVFWEKQKVLDLKIGDDLTEAYSLDNLNYQGVLILAMKTEKAAFKMYHDLASATDDPTLKATLLGLAQEEAKHKLRFEIEYDEEILKEN